MAGKKRKTTQEDRGSERVAPAERPSKRARPETQTTIKTRPSPAAAETPLQSRMTRARFKALQADETQEIQLDPGLFVEPRSRRARTTATTVTPPKRRNASCDQVVLATVTSAQEQQDAVEREYEMTPPVAPVAYMGGLGEELLVSPAAPVAPVQQQETKSCPSPLLRPPHRRRYHHLQPTTSTSTPTSGRRTRIKKPAAISASRS